jgi:histone H3/H4
MEAGDDEKLLPRATVAKFIKSKLRQGMRCGAETRELLLQSATEFVQLLSSEATEISNEQNKSKITTQHLLDAVSRLGFAEYQHEMQLIGKESHDGVCRSFCGRRLMMRFVQKKARGKARWKTDKTPEELLAAQQALFAKARNRTAPMPDEENKNETP